jgi:hypothetical protein
VAAEEHKRFREAFKTGQCCFCGDALTSFDQAKPCRHWLLNPAGVGKDHLELLAKQHSWKVLENYLRWVANEDAFAKNINDLADEGTGKLVELTIRYKNIEWSFSCSATDLSGHEGGGEHSRRPHYHFLMYVDGKPFIRYNDFHLPLSAPDIGFLEYTRANPGKVQVRSAPIQLDTIVMAPPGKAIAGEDIYNLIQAAKAEGVTIASKMRNLQGASVQTFVSPGPGVVRQATRSGRKKRRGDRKVRAQDRAWREQQKRER